jgi:hypothetical protein
MSALPRYGSAERNLPQRYLDDYPAPTPVHCTAFSLWSEFSTLPFVRLCVKQKATPLGGKTAHSSPGLRNPACLGKLQREPMDGALLVAASIVAAIRLRGQEITRSPKLVAVASDSVLLARTWRQLRVTNDHVGVSRSRLYTSRLQIVQDRQKHGNSDIEHNDPNTILSSHSLNYPPSCQGKNWKLASDKA